MASMPSSLRNRSGFPSVRLLGVLQDPPADETNGGDRIFELEEGEVVWSPASFSEQSSPPSPADSTGSISPLSAASSIRSDQALSRHFQDRRIGLQFTPERFGLSAALAEEQGPLLQQRRPTAVPPIPVPRPAAGSPARGPQLGRSAPVQVPVRPHRSHGYGDRTAGEEDDDWEGHVEQPMVPPHLIVARSHATTFSVFEGVGRTLKGRDLRRVRNAVFQKTGFLENGL